MSLFGLVRKGIRFYWRTSLGVAIAMAVSTAVMVGALVVGDSLRYSLARLVDVRLGKVEHALIAGDNFFTTELADSVAAKTGVNTATVLQLRGMAANDDGSRRVNRVSVLGVDDKFFKQAGSANTITSVAASELVLNDALAKRLDAEIGDEVLIRIANPSLMPRDVVLGSDSDTSTAFRLKVKAIIGEENFGRFSLAADQTAPMNAFVSRQWLAEKIDRPGKANLILADSGQQDQLQHALQQSLTLADLGIELKVLSDKDWIQATSQQVFINDTIAEIITGSGQNQLGVLTYFVNEIALGQKATPYSMVTAVTSPKKFADNGIMINDWLAEDISAAVGDEITLKYFVAGLRNKLIEKTATFTVTEIIPTTANPTLMPNFPGLADQENCSDWDPSVPVDLDNIRDKDEQYWDEYRGTPKAYITLASGQKIWANRFGKLTAVRFPAINNSVEEIEKNILSKLTAATAGLYFQDVRQRGVNAGQQGTDFGGLFLGLSMFLIVAAVVLVVLIFVFGVERRKPQAGMMLAMGFTAKQVKRSFLLEGLTLSLIGAAIGSIAGLLYTRLMIYGLSTVWASAVAGSAIRFHANINTVAIGAVSSVIVSMISIILSLRKHLKYQVRQLLSGVDEVEGKVSSAIKIRVGFFVAAALGLGAIVVMLSFGGEGAAAAGAFFGAGAMLLAAGLLAVRSLLKGMTGKVAEVVKSTDAVALRNTIRRLSRSMAVVTMLAVGSFLVVSVGANRHDTKEHQTDRDSGTGGFALIGEATIPVIRDIQTPRGVSVVQMRLRDGDDASCLNLNRAQAPALLGVDKNQLDNRGAFGFAKVIDGADVDDGWLLIGDEYEDNIVPAIGDYATVVWALGKSVGAELDYLDEKGNSFKLKIVGMIKDSVLQGKLMISEKNFTERFPLEEGYRAFLIDAPFENAEQVRSDLSHELRDFGVEIIPTAEKLAEFQAVENTYLSIFQILGGLALVIGSVGLGLVVLLNVLDRRGELRMMRAIGFDIATLKKMVLYEHIGLLAAGLICGIFSALIAVWPALATPGADVPYASLAITIAVILLSGIAWIWLATTFALRGKLIDALRNE